MIGVGVVGYGYWGPNLVRNFVDANGVALRHVCDIRRERVDLACRRYPGVRRSTDIEAMLADPKTHAIAIATPVSTHFQIAMRALEAGKHVLIEKPICETPREARKLIDEAERRGLILMIGHTFIYTPAVRRIKSMIEGGELGEIYYYDSTRINLGLFQHDADVNWDLAVHDLSILSYVLREKPIAVSAVGKSHVAGQPANVAYLTLFFDTNLIAHINVNWLAPVKIRRTLIGGSKKMIVYDDLEPNEKIRVYDKGVTLTDNPEEVHRMKVGYRIGDMWAPYLDNTEALSTEIAHFISCIERGARPHTDGAMGLDIIRILEGATISMRGDGRRVELSNQ